MMDVDECQLNDIIFVCNQDRYLRVNDGFGLIKDSKFTIATVGPVRWQGERRVPLAGKR